MKYALITGSSRGLGRSIAETLAKSTEGIIINYRNSEEEALKAKETCESYGAKAEILKFDVSDPEEIEKAMEGWENAHPEDYISVLVNNAGVREDNVMVFMTDEQWHKVIDTTLNGFFYLTRRVLKNMLVKRHGRIVNITSLSGLKGLPGQVNYSAAKAALIGATKALAQETARRKVTVNAVAPGFIETDMTAGLDRKQLSALVPMQRFGKPQEVADLVEFLVSDKAGYITGQVISINGGLY